MYNLSFNNNLVWKDKYNQLFNLKKLFKNKILIKFVTVVFSVVILSNIKANNNPRFIANQGQFNKDVKFKLEHRAGNIYFENNNVKFDLFQKDKINALKHGDISVGNILGHVYESNFIGYNKEVKILGQKKTNNFCNYFIGKDTSRWKSNIPIYNELLYENLYPGIDLSYFKSGGKLKYDFIVHPKADPENIKVLYKGLDSIYLKSGHLILKTSIGNVIEQAPLSYQIINGIKKIIGCKFQLEKNILTFKITGNYNKNYKLIIDPVLIFSTYSGSSANNWGETATYDNLGCLYAGSISFDNGYPVTLGAYDIFHNGGVGINGTGTDICISKFSPNGDSLKYSTYIGGTGNENPHSLVVNNNNELFVLGSTGSSDYPTTSGAYDTSFNSGDFFGFINYLTTSTTHFLEYPNGTDIIISKLSSDGSNLLGSTFIGGSKNDGINESGANNYNGNKLCHFYADEYRGEITLDNQGNCYVASSTSSLDFPLVNPAQNNLGGQQDAVGFKVSFDLSNILWSTYYGGSDDEAGYSIQLNSQNQPYITGGTISNDLFTSTDALNSNYLGNIDGFIANYNTQNGSILSSSYIGDSGFNQCYFVQIDLNDDIYLFGLTDSLYNIFPSTVYNSVGSQFIHKLDSNLSNTLISTSFGNGSLSRNITPSAFLVSNCGLIYISGWGGLSGIGGNTNNMPLVNAYQPNTDGADFYLAVFNNDMQSMLYGSFFGGNQSKEHVDGGTSRFDKNGKIYQAVCAGCQGNDDFPSTPNVVSDTNGGQYCNLGAFKFDLESISSLISIPSYFACLPNSYQFTSLSQGGNQYLWDFGDGNNSTAPNPNHNYSDTGIYNINLIVSDSNACILADTANIQIAVYSINNAKIIGDSILCPGTVATLNGYGGSQFIWSPINSLSSAFNQQVNANPTVNTTYMLVAIDSCGIDTAYFDVIIPNDSYQILNDTVICRDDSLFLFADGGVAYKWSGNNILNMDSANPIVKPFQSSTYYLEITVPSGCIYYDSVSVNVESSLPNIILQDTLDVCFGDSTFLTPNNINNAIWSPIFNSNDTILTSIWIKTDSNMTFFISSQNSCGRSTDSVKVLVFGYSGSAFGDTTICKGDSTEIFANDGIEYSWNPINSLSNADSNWTYAYPLQNTNYKVIIKNIYGCEDTFDVAVNVSPIPIVNAGLDFWMEYGESLNLNGSTNVSNFYWESNSWISCNTCLNPQINPEETTLYVLNVTDSVGCKNSDTVEINIDGSIFVPNTFTPNADGNNDKFEIKGENIKDFKLWIYNRWGEEIYRASEINAFWDGKYAGNKCKIDSYVWVIEFLDFNNNFKSINGHVNLIE